MVLLSDIEGRIESGNKDNGVGVEEAGNMDRGVASGTCTSFRHCFGFRFYLPISSFSISNSIEQGTTDTDLSMPFQRNVKEGRLFPVEFTVS